MAKLDGTSDPKQRLNMLYAIAGSGVQSEALLGISRKFLSDSDPGIQRAAVDAVGATGTRPEVVRIMSDLVVSPSASPEVKRRAQAIVAAGERSSGNQNH